MPAAVLCKLSSRDAFSGWRHPFLHTPPLPNLLYSPALRWTSALLIFLSHFLGQPFNRPPAVWLQHLGLADVPAPSLGFSGHRAVPCLEAWQQDLRSGVGGPSPGRHPAEAALSVAPRQGHAMVWPPPTAYRPVQSSPDTAGQGNKSLSSRKALSLLSQPFLVIQVPLAKFPCRRPCSRSTREGRRGPCCTMLGSPAKEHDLPVLASASLLLPAEESAVGPLEKDQRQGVCVWFLTKGRCPCNLLPRPVLTWCVFFSCVCVTPPNHEPLDLFTFLSLSPRN